MIKISESSMIKDYLAGFEPTGYFTFRNAVENENNHGLHKTIGDIGGFTGGFVLSGLTAGGGLYGASKVLTRMNPSLSKSLSNIGKETLSNLNPVRLYRNLKMLPESYSIVHDMHGSVGSLLDSPSSKALLDTGKSLVRRKMYMLQHGISPEKAYASGQLALGTTMAGVMSGGLSGLAAHTQYNSGVELKDKIK